MPLSPHPFVRKSRPLGMWEVACIGSGCFPETEGFGEVFPTWMQAMEVAYGHLAMHHSRPACSCPTDAEIQAAIHHSHQQLTGGNK